MFLFGIAFELPVFIVFLGFLGVISSETLKQSRRGVIIGITALAALFAPPDAISMLLLMIPLILFYEGSIWVVGRMEQNKLAKQFRSPKAQDSAMAKDFAGMATASEAILHQDPPIEDYDPFCGESK
jgi:Sec-independent protein secretion pathway component TatC